MNKRDLQSNVTDFLREQRISEKSVNTIKKYKYTISQFIEYLPDGCELTKEHTLSFKEYLLNSNYKPTTINLYIVSMNKYLKWIGAPELRVKQLKVQRKSSLSDVLTPEEYNRLLRRAKTQGQADTYYIMKVLANTGIRIAELKY